jgi:nucleotide-binding universal stress UspA family protein
MSGLLVYLPEDSERDVALDRARELAERASLPVMLATDGGDHASEMRRAGERLEALGEPLRRDGLAVQTRVLRGRAAWELSKLAARQHHALVIKSARPEDASAAFGNVARQLLRLCPVPVWIVRREPRRQGRAVVAAVDVAPDGGEGAARGLGQRILRQALWMAELQEAELHVVHAWRAYGEDTLRSPMLGVSEQERSAYAQEHARAARRALERLIRSEPEVERRAWVHLQKGDAAPVIAELADRTSADAVVMGTVARRGMAGFVVGNTAERVLRSSPTSIVAVKPEGFVSPALRRDDAPGA